MQEYSPHMNLNLQTNTIREPSTKKAFLEKACLALADGTVLQGISIGAAGTVCGEIVFNTAMSGYQEILTDPSYADQIITLTYPEIGNIGINACDNESNQIFAKALVIRHYSVIASHWQQEKTLDQFLKANNVVAISEVDTRYLVSILREKGSMGCCVTTELNEKKALEQAQNFQKPNSIELIRTVSTKEIYRYPVELPNYTIVVYDFGVKQSILQALSALDCEIWVVPFDTPPEEIYYLNPDGIILSNGPGDPKELTMIINNIRELIKLNELSELTINHAKNHTINHTIPILGICLGHQLLALALGAETIKMKFGHHGANHPVKNLITGQVMITSQNHGFMIDEKSLPDSFIITHRSLFDNTIQGIRHREKPIAGFQGHPEGGPGPFDAHPLFHSWMEMIKIRYKSRIIQDAIIQGAIT